MDPYLLSFSDVLGDGNVADERLVGIFNAWEAHGITDQEWIGLRRHLVIVAACAEACIIRQPADKWNADVRDLITASLLHDVAKRHEVEAIANSSCSPVLLDEMARIQQLYLMQAWGIRVAGLVGNTQHMALRLLENNPRAINEMAQALFLADGICEDKGLVSIDDRIQGLMRRYPNIDKAGFSYYRLSASTFTVLRKLLYQYLEQFALKHDLPPDEFLAYLRAAVKKRLDPVFYPPKSV
ncbi:MAG: hypothetical protein WC289_03525 [Patescibacteria group bacterium]